MTSDSPDTAPTPFTVTGNPKDISCLRYHDPKTSTSKPHLIFTHGAGGTLTSDGISNFAQGFARISPLVTFQGSMNLKSRVKAFAAVILDQSFANFLGGRSMGARAAVMAVTPETEKLVLVSYPLAGGEERSQILLALSVKVEVLFIVGEKDELCDLKMLNEVRREMKCKTWLIVVRGADHGMNVKPKSAIAEVGKRTGQAAAEWVRSHQSGYESEIYLDEESGEARQSEWKSASAMDGPALGGQGTERKATKAPKVSRKRATSKQPLEDGAERRVSTRRRNMG